MNLTHRTFVLISLIPKHYFIGYGCVNDRYLLFMLPVGALVAARGLLLLRNRRLLKGAKNLKQSFLFC